MGVTLQLTNPLFLTAQLASASPLKLKTTSSYKSFVTRAAADSDSTPSSTPPETDSDFEARLARLRYRSGTGKKAEVRKSRKDGGGSSTGASSGGSQSGVFLPPVALKEPVSGGLKVDFGFSPYSERLNGRIAGLGLTALLLVELATGQSTIKFHSPSIIFIQVYFVAAVTAVYVKFEKEKVSVWPEKTTKE